MNFDRSNSAGTDLDNVLDFLSADGVVTLPCGASKGEVLAYMIEELAAKGRLPRHLVQSITWDLTEREKLGTTGLGHGIALPHLRRHDVAEFTGLIGVAPEGIDFDSLDGWPTRVVILVISPFDQRERHLEILGRLATLLTDKTIQYFVQIPLPSDSLLRSLGIKTKGLPCNE